jgi:glucose-6-phosphate isomerase
MHSTHSSDADSYASLKTHYLTARDWQIADLFANDSERFSRLSVEAAGLTLDYSKNRLNGETMQLLWTLTRQRGMEERRDAMFAGEKINSTEHRAVLHTALRAPQATRLKVDSQDVIADVHAVLNRMGGFCDKVRSGEWKGFTGKAITDVVNIGIGGSYLGPKMACQALRAFSAPQLSMHFVSNVDGHDLAALFDRIDPQTTLFVIASKTFTTLETMMNARSARTWFLQHGSEADLAKHFVAVSTNTDAVKAFGIDPENMFPFWDWVGGRYSVWSAIGLPVALAVGMEQFRAFLAGGHAMDEHFRTAPLERNMPAILALVGYWYREFFHSTSVSIAPYHQDLADFPGYLQQLEMESNGKSVTTDAKPISYPTCPVIWGDTGTNGQHAFFQLLHQGTDLIPVDFITALKPSHDLPGHHDALLANCFAQSEALMKGKSANEIRRELQAQGLGEEEIAHLIPHKTFSGNRPSNTLLMDELNPSTLGALIALYEHKTFVQGVLWNINSFDQWGVELGKVLAKAIQSELEGKPDPEKHDGSTNALIARARAARQRI